MTVLVIYPLQWKVKNNASQPLKKWEVRPTTLVVIIYYYISLCNHILLIPVTT